MRRQAFNGFHMATILVAFFGVVVAVNLFMAREALATFGGIVVENSYVASQEFNGWLDEARTEKALGWQATVGRDESGHVTAAFTGAPEGLSVNAEARHPLGRLPDSMLNFVALGGGLYVSRETLPAGRWTIRLAAKDGARIWRIEEHLQ
jgi:nitrogen fixation protein FixH